MHKKGFVYLVGAGCGSADLITVRGCVCAKLRRGGLRRPHRSGPAGAGRARAEQHPAGKRCGRHSMPQSEINSLLVRLGQSGKTVVRLKGGDPFVFGRGGEEFLALQAAGRPVRKCRDFFVHRGSGRSGHSRHTPGASRSFHVITGHTAQTGDTLPESLEALAALHGTLVFLMGLNSLEQIAARLTAAGKPETPAAVSGGNAPHSGHGARHACGHCRKGARSPGAGARRHRGGRRRGAGAFARPRPCCRWQCARGAGGNARLHRTARPAFEALARPRFLHDGRVRLLPPQPGWERLADGRSCWVVLTSRNGCRLLF
ncbi:MAG: uroporphyrinogen-III C-methyltransferase [Ruthenibacterium lactatiformans]